VVRRIFGGRKTGFKPKYFYGEIAWLDRRI
jgi:hypothetical protein